MALNDLSKSAWCKLSRTAQNLLSGLHEDVDENCLRLIDLLSQKHQRVMTINGNEQVKSTIKQPERTLIGGDQVQARSIDLVIGKLLPYKSISFEQAYKCLKASGYIAVITEDRWHDQQYELCHAKLTDDLTTAGFTIQGLIVLMKSQKILKPYGYPKTFVPNITNQFAVIARKS